MVLKGTFRCAANVTIPSGTNLGRYEFRSQLGAGGMGAVYRARDTKLNREVAIKVLPEGFTEDAETCGPVPTRSACARVAVAGG